MMWTPTPRLPAATGSGLVTVPCNPQGGGASHMGADERSRR